jgi:NDP-sugar pyrophosphorylase family protein
MILAAGLSTRLRPITSQVPKILVSPLGYPLLYLQIRQLESLGIERIFINTHYLGDMIRRYIQKIASSLRSEIIISDESEQLLGTGGGLAKIRTLLQGDHLLVMNGDMLSNIDLSAFVATHFEEKQAMTMLLLQPRVDSKTPIWTNTERTRVLSLREPAKEPAAGPFSNGIVQLLQRECLDKIPGDQPSSIVPVWEELLKKKQVACHIADKPVWFDIGDLPSLRGARNSLKLKDSLAYVTNDALCL